MELRLLSRTLSFGLACVLAGCGANGRPLTASQGSPAESVEAKATPALGGGPKSTSPATGGASHGTSADGGESAEPEAAAPTPEMPRELPAGTTVLHVGDSFAGALGLDLNRELRSAGIRSILKYKTASYIPEWAWGKELTRYLSTYHPDLVLVTLGANELEIAEPEQRVRAIEKIVSVIGARPCVWIAPPLWKGARPHLLEVIERHCAPCAYMDSGQLLPDLPRARDGIHPTESARATWATAVVAWLKARRLPNAGRPWALKPDD